MPASPATPLLTTSFTAALWFMAHGFDPTSVSLNPTDNQVLYTFPPEARRVWDAYAEAKARLTSLRRGAR